MNKSIENELIKSAYKRHLVSKIDQFLFFFDSHSEEHEDIFENLSLALRENIDKIIETTRNAS